jgi:hypothetical protein
MIPGKHCDYITNLPKRARAQSGAWAEVQFPNYGTDVWAPGSRNDSKRALRFQHLSCLECQSSVWSMRRFALCLIMEQRCGPLAVEIVPRKHCEFRTYLAKRAGSQSGACAEVQFLDYGTVLWSPGSRNISRKHSDFSTYLAKRAGAHSGACSELQFPDYGTVLWSPGSRHISRKHFDFSTYPAKRSRAQSVACTEEHFPDYGKVLWSPGSRNSSRQAL